MNANEQQQLEQIKDYALGQATDDETGHGVDHIMRVVRMAKTILRRIPQANELITLAAAYLHDTYDEKLVTDVPAAKQALRDTLTTIGLTADQVSQIFAIIDNMSYSKSLEGAAQPLTLEGQVVQDADRLDAIGAIGITRAIYYGGRFGEKVYDPSIAPRTDMNHDEYRNLDHETIINHFYEKLLKLKDLMNTDVAVSIAAHRQEVMVDFLGEYQAEWHGEE
ncbi:HD domain-containing protein [Levilactobacillus bambusae]|uniref:Phosphohydrolase n=1 Tax=Levilactobacillus bambusae TaxID=2024736 RepID=A0A2V1MXT8_9LACO|nr:HD domain-containing protein [Levilactobacillus bambusae]PWF99853.1 phosphohydrolase [Levilactobacillus bambusae]